ncbi:MAG TPA: hypothetical protein VHP37_29370 [Burkholderiales bacterium]|jgi:hypothetical protein|nr:hypothetical protein [Burkholderiales bacterium]
MKHLVLAAAVFAAMCGITIGTVATEFATPASAATATAVTVDVYKDAN